MEKALTVLESAARPLVIVGKGMAMPMPRDLRGALVADVRGGVRPGRGGDGRTAALCR